MTRDEGLGSCGPAPKMDCRQHFFFKNRAGFLHFPLTGKLTGAGKLQDYK